MYFIMNITIEEIKCINSKFFATLFANKCVRGTTLIETAHPGQAP